MTLRTLVGEMRLELSARKILSPRLASLGLAISHPLLARNKKSIGCLSSVGPVGSTLSVLLVVALASLKRECPVPRLGFHLVSYSSQQNAIPSLASARQTKLIRLPPCQSASFPKRVPRQGVFSSGQVCGVSLSLDA